MVRSPAAVATDTVAPLLLDSSTRALLAFSQLGFDEQRAILLALHALLDAGVAHAADVRKLQGSASLYVVRATPDLRLVVRAESGVPVEVMDIIRPAALANFTYAS